MSDENAPGQLDTSDRESKHSTKHAVAAQIRQTSYREVVAETAGKENITCSGKGCNNGHDDTETDRTASKRRDGTALER